MKMDAISIAWQSCLGGRSAVLTNSAVILLICWLLWVVMKRWKDGYSSQLPPGPRGLPLIGSLPFLEHDIHIYFDKLAKVYGPVMKLQLGSKLCIVLSSSSAAKEVLRDQDIMTFANRDAPVVGIAQSYGCMDIIWAPYGPQWRMLRKVFVHELMSNTSLDACSGLRRLEVRRMVRDVHANVGAPINVGETTYAVIFNVITSMLWGDTIKGEERSRIVAEFRDVLAEIVELYGKANLSDYFPILAPFDMQGVVRKMKNCSLWIDQTLDAIIDRWQTEAREGGGRRSTKERKDFLQILWQLKDQGDPKMPLTTTHIKALFTDIILAGTDTTWTTTEWAMAEIMQHPKTMRRAQEELEQVVGLNNTVEESHLPKLQYLDAVVKEVLRLHPVIPLMLPRAASKSSTIAGYMIPKGSRILINVWKIQRDPDAWDDPLEFKPERFLGGTGRLDYKANDYRYFPFGSGRRLCAGMPIAEKMLMYVLATFLHSFEWNLPEQTTTLDLTEKFGVVLKKAKPLLAIPTPRLSNAQLYA